MIRMGINFVDKILTIHILIKTLNNIINHMRIITLIMKIVNVMVKVMDRFHLAIVISQQNKEELYGYI